MNSVNKLKICFLQKILPVIITCALTVGLACGSYAWYSSSVKLDFNKDFSGSTDVAYFAGGDGSISDPYIINNRYHIYNLAWLQYLGYFNLGSQVNNGRAQNYFKITANIDMDGLAIPPIGTEKYKFIGNLLGNGYAVSNLVVSNDINSLTVRPSTINSVDDCSIVGFFGVLGASATELTQMETDGKTAIVGTEAVTVEVDNTSAAPSEEDGQAANLIYKKAISASNFYLDKINVVSTTANTLIGVAAGYVAGNLQNVGVYQSAVSVAGSAKGLATALTDGGSAYGTTVSRYSIVGDYDEKNVTWNLPSGAGGKGDGNVNGGSIDFRKLSRRINYIATAYYLGKDKPVPAASSSTGVYSFSESAFNSNFRITFQKKADFGQFNWKDGNFTDITYCDLQTETYLPINVDDTAMGLDAAGNNNTIDNESWYINEEYYKASSYYHTNNPEYTGSKGETPRSNNTGYIVGGADGNTFLRLRIQTLATKSTTGVTINKSFGADNGVGLEYSEKTLQLLTKTAVANDKFAVIFDDYNDADGQATAHTQFDSVLSTITVNGKSVKTTYGNLGLTRYDKDGVRDDFANFLGGANKYVYGLRFQQSSSSPQFIGKAIDINNETLFLNIDDTPYLKSSIDFNFEQDGVITMVVGTYMSSNPHAFCGLYKEVNGTIQQVTEIKQNTATKKYYSTYYNGSTTTSDDKPAGNYITVFNREWFTSLPGRAAYYVEIPVSAGHYFICNDYRTSLSNYAYLMYLDIGANGDGGGTGDTPVHTINGVNFVNQAPSGTKALAFAEYDVVVFVLADTDVVSAKIVIYFKRKTEDTTAGETKKSTIVYYYPDPDGSMGTITPTPSAYGVSNAEAKNWA